MQNVLSKLKLNLSRRLGNREEQKRESRRTLMLNAKAMLRRIAVPLLGARPMLLVANKMFDSGVIP